MSLDGLRAWIGVVERKLTMRTRVFLVLVAIAIGGAGAGIYLALDAQDSTVSEADLQALRDELSAQAATPESTGELAQLQAEVSELKATVETLKAEVETKSGGTGTGEQTPPRQPQADTSSGGTPDAREAQETEKQSTKGETAR